ncbi:hypothetical protein AB0N28_22195 [Streptomyces sp. NPDC051130]|uniref:RCC1 domain-containing protein n=1 Tax=Streptomyces sp. NPDC051130 TaxID=3157223 RepID=UPI0034361D5D
MEVDAGCYHALALTSDGAVKSWGYNLYGQLGNSTTKSSTLPVDVDGFEGVTDIEAGAYHNYAQTSDSHVWGWGNNQYGQLLQEGDDSGDNVSRTNRTTPVEIPRLEGAQHLAAGLRHGAAFTDDDVFTWGNNSEGQLGNGSTVSRYESVKILTAHRSRTSRHPSAATPPTPADQHPPGARHRGCSTPTRAGHPPSNRGAETRSQGVSPAGRPALPPRLPRRTRSGTWSDLLGVVCAA